MSEENDVILICIRADEPGELIAGTALARCSQCGCEVYVAPSGRNLVASAGAEIHCPECAKARIEAADEANFHLTQEQMSELDNHFRRN